jgi:serine/threonine-protein kinase
MSPEQAEGSGPVDARSDQYSLACVIYEMLTGKPPFTATSPVALLAQHVSVAAPSIRATRGDTPAGVAGALTQALHKSPTKRFGTMAAFESALSVR